MADDLGIKGIRPIDDRPSGQQRNRGGGKKFTLDAEDEEKEKGQEKKKIKKPRAPAKDEKSKKPSITRKEDGGIDILI